MLSPRLSLILASCAMAIFSWWHSAELRELKSLPSVVRNIVTSKIEEANKGVDTTAAKSAASAGVSGGMVSVVVIKFFRGSAAVYHPRRSGWGKFSWFFLVAMDDFHN